MKQDGIISLILVWLIVLFIFQSLETSLLRKMIIYADIFTIIITISATVFAYLQWKDSKTNQVMEKIYLYKSKLETNLSNIWHQDTDEKKYILSKACITDFVSQLNLLSSQIKSTKDQQNFELIFQNIFSSSTIQSSFIKNQTYYKYLNKLYIDWNLSDSAKNPDSTIDIIFKLCSGIQTQIPTFGSWVSKYPFNNPIGFPTQIPTFGSWVSKYPFNNPIGFPTQIPTFGSWVSKYPFQHK